MSEKRRGGPSNVPSDTYAISLRGPGIIDAFRIPRGHSRQTAMLADEKNSDGQRVPPRSAARALIRIPKNEGTRDYQIGWPARSRRLRDNEARVLEAKGVATVASITRVSSAELFSLPLPPPSLSPFRFSLSLSHSSPSLSFPSFFCLLPFLFLFFLFYV